MLPRMKIAPLLPPAETSDAGTSSLARGVVGSEILKIAAEIRLLKAAGAEVCNLTVGDFDPAYFPIPADLLAGVRHALAQGHTNYPPSDGVLALREAVARFYARALGLEYPVEGVLIAAGARPLLYGSYRTLVDPGDVVIYPVPSWNNNHYAYLTGARAIALPVGAEANFFPTAAQLAPLLRSARMLCLNSPLNPTGTLIDADALRHICTLVVEENHRRRGDRPLFLVYDQVYWTLTFDAAHVTPVGLVPEIAPYTILLDALSKAVCGTGLRVGWAVMPPAIRTRMADILGHVGAWAPKAEQVATAAFLDDPHALQTFQDGMKAQVRARLERLYHGFEGMREDGLPVRAIAPQGAIYLSVRFDLFGKEFRGRTIATNEDIRRLLLEAAGLAIVPFQAFGLTEDSGWFRLSVGAVSLDDIGRALVRVREVLS